MKKVVRLKITEETSAATQVWMKHLIHRCIIDQLELPTSMKVKLLHELSRKE